MKPNRPILVLTAFTALVLGGCSSLDETKDVGHYVVSAPKTPLYRYGPAQSFGADYNVMQGQHVVMIRRDSGYSRIMTDDGQTGYVATEDLSPAPPPPKPTPSTPSRVFARGGGGGGSRISSANRQIQESGPLFNDTDLPPLPVQNYEETSGSGKHKAEPPKPEPKGEEKKSEEKKSDEKKPGDKPQFRYPKPRPGFRVNVETKQ